MTALTSNSAEWQTPPWLVERIRTAMGEISFDAATTAANPVGAAYYATAEIDALAGPWEPHNADETLFCNPPGDRSGRLVRYFWAHWNAYATGFRAACWVGFNLDQLRFVRGGTLVIPHKRVRYINPATGREGPSPTVGSFLLFRGKVDLSPFVQDCTVGVI